MLNYMCLARTLISDNVATSLSQWSSCSLNYSIHFVRKWCSVRKKTLNSKNANNKNPNRISIRPREFLIHDSH